MAHDQDLFDNETEWVETAVFDAKALGLQTFRLAALCEVLDLEFYIGPPRVFDETGFDLACVVLALEALDRGFPDAARRLSVHERGQLLVAVYVLLGGEDARANAEQVSVLIAIARRFGVGDALAG